jgi:hypothetical protein
MNQAQKIALGIVLTLGVLLAATVAWAGATVVSDGFVTVRVHESGPGGARLFIPIPGTAVRAVAHSVRWNGAGRERLRAELAEVRPVLEAIGDELAACPDMRLVEVETDHEHVIVEKDGGSLRITIDDRGDHVEVSVPLDLALDVLDGLSA